jgi:murein DD-endopeptidase MepM/ murein hydrolase activator NlpD
MTDANSIDATGVRGTCAWCAGSLEPHHFVQVAGAKTLALCSEECLGKKQQHDAATRAARLRRRLKVLVIGSSLVAACITPHDGPLALRKPVLIAKAPAPSEAEPLPGSFGPEWPPSEASLIAELGHDAWLHPLAGPFRRMPARDSRVFGAERPGDRPIDCRKGHCGVDLGGEIWGEQVRAVHDGVVDRVQRAANEQHGGHYVRIAHHNGTVFTQYFHLAAIPRWVEAGVPVKAGDVIGLLGDTGVKESSPHVHFTVSVRPAPSWPEQYVDPEPLIALWPLRIPLADSPIVLISTEGRPGVPLGGAPAGSRKQPKATKRPHAPAKSDDSDGDRERALPAAPADDAPGTESSE